MLRRVAEGLGLCLIAWMLLNRIGAGVVVVALAWAAIIAFTGWRIHGLWGRYQLRLAEQRALRAAEAAGDDDAANRRMLALRGQQHARGAELTFWTGFMLGGAAIHGASGYGAYGGTEMGTGGAFDPGSYDPGAGGIGGMGGDIGGGGI